MLLKALLLLLLGSVSGTCSGLVGIGGATLLTPALIYLFVRFRAAYSSRYNISIASSTNRFDGCLDILSARICRFEGGNYYLYWFLCRNFACFYL